MAFSKESKQEFASSRGVQRIGRKCGSTTITHDWPLRVVSVRMQKSLTVSECALPGTEDIRRSGSRVAPVRQVTGSKLTVHWTDRLARVPFQNCVFLAMRSKPDDFSFPAHMWRPC